MPKPKAVIEAQEKVDAIRKEMGIIPEGTQGEKVPTPPEKEDGKLKPTIIPDMPPEAIEVSPKLFKIEGQEKKPIVPAVNFEQEYKVLKGKYDKEVPRLNASLKEFNEKLATAQATIANLNELVLSLSSGRQSGKEDEDDDQGLKPAVVARLNPEDFEGYGPEMVDTANLINFLLEENKALKQGQTETLQSVEQVRTVQAGDESTKFFTALTKGVPNWEAINQEQWWHDWLGEIDSYSGIKRQALVDNAVNSYDAPRLVAILKGAMKDCGYKEDGGRPLHGNLGEQVVPDTNIGSQGAPIGGFTPVTDEQLNKAKMDKVRGKITMDQFKDVVNRYILTNQQAQG